MAHGHVTRASFFNMVAPPLHHGGAAFEVVGAVVGVAYLIAAYVGEGCLDEVGVEALFV